MPDWGTWPLFTLQLFAGFILFLPRDKKIFGILPKTFILLLLWLILIGIVMTLYHNSTDPLHLNF